MSVFPGWPQQRAWQVAAAYCMREAKNATWPLNTPNKPPQQVFPVRFFFLRRGRKESRDTTGEPRHKVLIDLKLNRTIRSVMTSVLKTQGQHVLSSSAQTLKYLYLLFCCGITLKVLLTSRVKLWLTVLVHNPQHHMDRSSLPPPPPLLTHVPTLENYLTINIICSITVGGKKSLASAGLSKYEFVLNITRLSQI